MIRLIKLSRIGRDPSLSDIFNDRKMIIVIVITHAGERDDTHKDTHCKHEKKRIRVKGGLAWYGAGVVRTIKHALSHRAGTWPRDSFFVTYQVRKFISL